MVHPLKMCTVHGEFAASQTREISMAFIQIGELLYSGLVKLVLGKCNHFKITSGGLYAQIDHFQRELYDVRPSTGTKEFCIL